MCADGPAVVIGQCLVGEGFLLILDHLLCPEQLPFIPQVLVQLLCPVLWHRRVGQDRRQDGLQVVHDA